MSNKASRWPAIFINRLEIAIEEDSFSAQFFWARYEVQKKQRLKKIGQETWQNLSLDSHLDCCISMKHCFGTLFIDPRRDGERVMRKTSRSTQIASKAYRQITHTQVTHISYHTIVGFPFWACPLLNRSSKTETNFNEPLNGLCLAWQSKQAQNLQGFKMKEKLQGRPPMRCRTF